MPLRSSAALFLLVLLAVSARAAGSGEDVIAGFRETARAQKESRARAQSAVGDYDRHVAELNAAFDRTPADPRDKKWVALKLRHMAEVDGYERDFNVQTPGSLNFTGAEKDEFRMQLSQRAKAIDEANRADLKELLKIYPWFKISGFGEQADKDAWYLVQHADADPIFRNRSWTFWGAWPRRRRPTPRITRFCTTGSRFPTTIRRAESLNATAPRANARVPKTGGSSSRWKTSSASTKDAKRWGWNQRRNTRS